MMTFDKNVKNYFTFANADGIESGISIRNDTPK